MLHSVTENYYFDIKEEFQQKKENKTTKFQGDSFKEYMENLQKSTTTLTILDGLKELFENYELNDYSYDLKEEFVKQKDQWENPYLNIFSSEDGKKTIKILNNENEYIFVDSVYLKYTTEIKQENDGVHVYYYYYFDAAKEGEFKSIYGIDFELVKNSYYKVEYILKDNSPYILVENDKPSRNSISSTDMIFVNDETPKVYSKYSFCKNEDYSDNEKKRYNCDSIYDYRNHLYDNYDGFNTKEVEDEFASEITNSYIPLYVGKYSVSLMKKPESIRDISPINIKYYDTFGNLLSLEMKINYDIYNSNPYLVYEFEDFKNKTRIEINNNLINVSYTYVYDGEEL